MPRLRLLVATLFLASACAGSEPRGPRCETLVVSTWNVRRLFDERCDSGECGPSLAEDAPSATEVEASVRRVASAVRALDSDVTVLEEIENRALLDRVAAACGCTVHATIGESRTPGSIDVAVLSRLPIVRVVHHRDARLVRDDGSTTYPTRDLLEVELAARPRPVIVFAAHLKSQRLDDPERRHAEARLAGSLARRRAEERDAVVMLAGDLNDVPGSTTLRILEEQHGLFRATSALSPEEAFTLVHEGRPELLDHVLLPMEQQSLVLPGSVTAVRGAGVGYGGSDHAAIRLAIRLEDGADGGRGTVGTCVPSSRPSPSP